MIPQTMKRIAIAWACFVVVGVAQFQIVRGDISLPKIFSDHMVLQRNSTVNVWGSAEPNQKLLIRFAGNEVRTAANAKGDWAVKIQTLEAGGPYELEVSAEEGEPKVVFSDVMVGEVWLCSGQCNMEWPVAEALNAENEIQSSKNHPNLRLFSVGNGISPQPLGDFAKVEPWSVCSPETVKDFSAVAYFFGREISKELKDVPIGLIDASWKGTVCEAWTSRQSLEKVPELAALLQQWKESDRPTSPNRPGNVFNAMIAPMTRFPIRGVIWYQGEANHERGQQYATLFPTLINDWRNQFKLGAFPFYFVQLAPYRYKQKPAQSLAEVRDAQLKTLKSVANTQMVVTTDIGDLLEIQPKNKQEVGRRLALAALANVYAELLPEDKPGIVFSGPIYEEALVEGRQIRITFTHVDGGLKIRNDEPELTCFTISGADGKFVPANARIVDDSVIVQSPDVEKPVAVRFGWNDSDQPNLINAQGLPASPFRTDKFPLISAGREF